MAALLPFVRFLKRHKFPTFLAVMVPYILLFVFLFILIFPLFPFFANQLVSLAKGLPLYINKITKMFGISIAFTQIEQYITNSIGNVGESAVILTSTLFGGIFALFTIIVVSLYLYLFLYHERFKEQIARLFPKKSQPKVHDIFNEIDEKLGAWMRGQVLLCISIGLLAWIGLMALRLPYALPLALIAGLLEIVPTLGPIMSAIPGIIMALTISPTMALTTAGMYVVIQLLENHLIVPNIMKQAVGMNPLLVIIAVIIGSKLLGVIGALLSIPFVSLLIILLKYIPEET